MKRVEDACQLLPFDPFETTCFCNAQFKWQCAAFRQG
jgi:hypothetical protein